MKRLTILATLTIVGCSGRDDGSATLYRNSELDPAMRVHFASFNAEEKTPYNLNNCQMTARVLNANVAALAKGEGRELDGRLGFWCEPGPFREDGITPLRFDSAFPTDSFGR